MAVRSQPVAVTPVLTRTGQVTYRVTGTINRNQRKRQFLGLADAEAVRDAWESERLSGAAALRPKITRLTKLELEEAEACHFMLKGSGLSLRDAVASALRNPPPKPCALTFAQAYEQFLDERQKHISATHCANYRSPCRRLAEFLGPETKLDGITTERITAWLESLKDITKKSWNNYRGDLAVVFNWFVADPRNWLTKNPVIAVPRYRKRDTLPGPVGVLTVKTVRAMMAAFEREQPHWVTFFALAVFAGVRPDRYDGEMWKLSQAITEHGINKYFRGGKLHLTAKIAKDGRARTIPLSSNLQEWLKRYPVTPNSLLAGNRAEYAAIRARWKIPHDGLRHTSMSACAALHGITAAVARHGNSERICLDHYLDLFERDEAEAFYAIMPIGPDATDAISDGNPLTQVA